MSTWNPGGPSDPSGQNYGQQPQQPSYGQPQQQPSYGQPPAYGAQPQPYGQQPGYGGYPQPPQNPYAPQQGGLPPGAVRPLNIGNRVLAFIIDWLILAVPIGILYVIFAAVFISSIHTTYDANGFAHTSGGGGAGLVLFLIFALSVGGFLYFAYLTGKTGQTPGKKVMGVKVIDANTGGVIGFGKAIGRVIVQALCNIVCYAGLWSAFLDGGTGRYQGWHDKALGTQVISVK